MKFVITFGHSSARYACHVEGCSAAVDKERGHGARTLIRVSTGNPMLFRSTADARTWADADESEKAGQPTKANWKVCACAKVSRSAPN